MSEQTPEMDKQMLSQFSTQLAGVVESAGQSVVTVYAGRRMPASGIIWSADGVIVTAEHAIENEEGIKVMLPDGTTATASLVGRDPTSDIAVLRVSAAALKPLETADNVRVGNIVLAISRSPIAGLAASYGIISAVTRPWRTWHGGESGTIMLTDAALYPGFSGGPLVNVEGKMAGLSSSMLIRGIGAAVPSATVRRIVNELLSGGKVRRGFLGIGTQSVAMPADLAGRLGISQSAGLLVVGVEPGSPANKSGLLLGDVLVGFGGKPVQSGEELRSMLGGDTIGGKIEVQIIRGGELKTVTVVPGEHP
jgi:S1-C subfamily serine protease